MERKRPNIWSRLVWLSVVLPIAVSSDDVNVDTTCFGEYFRLRCEAGLVISIVWNGTLFGRSICSSPCCPEYTNCSILVTESEHADEDHWDVINTCNGKQICPVQALRSDTHSCRPTDYENVTYKCVTPGMSSTSTVEASTSSIVQTTTTSMTLPSTVPSSVFAGTVTPEASNPHTRITMEGGVSSEQSVTSSASLTTSLPASVMPTQGSPLPGEADKSNGGDMLGILIAVAVAAVFLIIVVLAVVVFIYCRRKRKAAAKDKEAPFKDEIIKRPDRTYSTPGKQPMPDENGYDAHGSNSPAAVSADTPPKPVTFGPVNGDYYSQPQKIRPTETSAKPLGSSLYSQPVEARLADENPEEHYSYAYGQFRDQNQVSPAGGDRAAEGKGSVIYADIMHQQNEEYLEEDDTILTENSLYSATVDTLPGQKAEDTGNDGDDDDDMMITDNDVYEMNEGDSSHQQQDQAEDADDDDDDMILTDNDLYSAT